jgi:hypothetical protein
VVEFLFLSATTTAQNKTPKVFWLVHEVLSHPELNKRIIIISLLGIYVISIGRVKLLNHTLVLLIT